MEQKKRNPIQRIWDLAKKEHGLLKKSIALSVIAVIVGFLPYLCAAKIITLLVEGKADAGQIILCVLAAFAANEAKTLFAAWSTSVSHRATFAVLARIRHNALKKLANLSLGTLEAESSGKWKTILVDRIESMEKTMAHVFPEFTGNICGVILLIIAMMYELCALHQSGSACYSDTVRTAVLYEWKYYDNKISYGFGFGDECCASDH